MVVWFSWELMKNCFPLGWRFFVFLNYVHIQFLIIIAYFSLLTSSSSGVILLHWRTDDAAHCCQPHGILYYNFFGYGILRWLLHLPPWSHRIWPGRPFRGITGYWLFAGHVFHSPHLWPSHCWWVLIFVIYSFIQSWKIISLVLLLYGI